MRFSKINLLLYAGVSLFALLCMTSCEDDSKQGVDTKNPEIISYNPVSGIEDVPLKSNLVITFDEIVEKGSGNITIKTDKESETQSIDVSSDAVSIGKDKRIVTVNPKDFKSGKTYEVIIDRGFVKDLVGNEFMGTHPDTPWTFVSGGNSGPQLLKLIPENGSTEGNLFKLQLTFNGGVKKGSGYITIYDDKDAIVEKIDILDKSATLSEDKAFNIELTNPLQFNKDYYVKIDDGAIMDIAGNNFPGFSDKESWNFKTTTGSNTELVVHLPLDIDLRDISGNKFNATKGVLATSDFEFVSDAQRGKVIHFAAGSYAQLPKHELLRPSETQDFSINFWVKLQGIGSDPAIFSNSSWNSGGNPGILLCTAGGDTYTSEGEDGSGWIVNLAGDPKADGNRMDWKAGKTNPKAPSMSDNKWHMVSIVLDQGNKTLHVYIDGQEYSSPEIATSYNLNTLTGPLWDKTEDYPFTIWEDGTGEYNSGNDTRKNLDGFIDDLTMYNKALTASEVNALYNN